LRFEEREGSDMRGESRRSEKKSLRFSPGIETRKHKSSAIFVS
jgi:hypothetical protein